MTGVPAGPPAAVGMHLVVGGRVQGVGYRWFTRCQARGLGLPGWVANQPDGAVRVAVEGPSDRVDRFVAALRQGPPGARVERLDITPVAVAQALPDPFEIR